MNFSSSYVKLCIRMRLSWIWRWEWKSVTFSRSLSQPNDHVGFARPGCQRDGPVAGLSPVVNLRFWTFIAPVYWQTNKDAQDTGNCHIKANFFFGSISAVRKRRSTVFLRKASIDQRRVKKKVHIFLEKASKFNVSNHCLPESVRLQFLCALFPERENRKWE